MDVQEDIVKGAFSSSRKGKDRIAYSCVSRSENSRKQRRDKLAYPPKSGDNRIFTNTSSGGNGHKSTRSKIQNNPRSSEEDFPANTRPQMNSDNYREEIQADSSDGTINNCSSGGPGISDVENVVRKPDISYIALISMAIQSSQNKRMLLSEIYKWISEKYPYFRMQNKSWRNSIRHNLSLNECFVKNGRSESGKGNYWAIHPANIHDFSLGDFRRRHARRRVRKCDEDLQRLCMPRNNGYDTGSRMYTDSFGKQNENAGYVPMASTYVTPGYINAMFGIDSIFSGKRLMNPQYPSFAAFGSTSAYTDYAYGRPV